MNTELDELAEVKVKMWTISNIYSLAGGDMVQVVGGDKGIWRRLNSFWLSAVHLFMHQFNKYSQTWTLRQPVDKTLWDVTMNKNEK